MAKKNKKTQTEYPVMSNVASGMETTGLMATFPQSTEAYESLLEDGGLETPGTAVPPAGLGEE